MLRKMLVLLMIVSTIANADCNKSLGLCQKLVGDVSNENLLLKQKIGVLVQQRDEAEKQLAKATQPALIPTWGWFVLGAFIGGAAYAVVRR